MMARKGAKDDLHGTACHKYLQAISVSPKRWNLFEFSLHVATIRHPGLDFSSRWDRLRELQSLVVSGLEARAERFGLIERINQVLFQEPGFSETGKTSGV